MYISQILVASALGSVVDTVGSVRVIPALASGGSFLGFLTACFLVIYPDVEATSSEQDQDSDDLPRQSDPREEKNREQRLALLKLKDRVQSKTTENLSVAWTVQSLQKWQKVDVPDAEVFLVDWQSQLVSVLLLPRFRKQSRPGIQIASHRVAVSDYWNRWNISWRDTIGQHIKHFCRLIHTDTLSTKQFCETTLL